jgi:serine protease Do
MAKRLLFQERTVWSGVTGYLLTGEMARAFNVPEHQAGLLVQRVAHGSLAERLGLRGGHIPTVIGGEQLLVGGDILVAVDGIALGTRNAYDDIRRRLIGIRDRNGSLQVSVLRGGAIVNLTGNVDH